MRRITRSPEPCEPKPTMPEVCRFYGIVHLPILPILPLD